MKFIVCRLLPLVICLITLTSCWSSKELNQVAIATAIGIDKSDDGYLLSVQVLNPGEIVSQNPTSRAAVTTYRTTGGTLFEAFRRLTVEAPRKVYFSHVQKVVFGEELAESGILKTLDFLSRDHEMRTDFLLVIAKDTKADELLKILTPMDKIPASKMVSSLEMSEKNWAPTHTVKLDELINTLVGDGVEAVLTGINLKGDPEIGIDMKNVEKVDPPTTIQIGNIGVFKGDKLVGWLNEDESKGFNYLQDNVESTIINVPCSENSASVEVVNTNTKLKVQLRNHIPTITATVRIEGNVGDVECSTDFTNPKNLEDLENKVENDVKDKMEKSVKAAKELNSDIFGFGTLLYRSNPNEWKVMKKSWDDDFQDVEVNYEVHATIPRLGTITESFQRKGDD
ncbi:Ger(x)C family spore germination protein [Pseudalkalibacillus hwajinpoensis]|uniref:Ger(X)C family spore germination protein n=1 Tax=Guptibacillus hwajinpoensis TaxID=208199 RepID=A0A4U1MN45_9BACL|nr:Ger(x)C family spore germination protein [Pseudalkalibacillus hwajinpoensis]TKD72095.1 Ger(x)C family spore germination protein [Pseudalkalibacillus hwajinpoensis]